MLWSAWKLSAKLALSSWVYRILSVWIILALVIGIFWFFVQIVGTGQAHPSFAFHYTVYLGIDDVRSISWAILWPGIWILSDLVFLICAYGTYRRDPHAGIAWLVIGAFSALPWMLVLHYLALLNR